MGSAALALPSCCEFDATGHAQTYIMSSFCTSEPIVMGAVLQGCWPKLQRAGADGRLRRLSVETENELNNLVYNILYSPA